MELSIVRSLPCIVTSPSPSEVPTPPPVTAVFPCNTAIYHCLYPLDDASPPFAGLILFHAHGVRGVPCVFVMAKLSFNGGCRLSNKGRIFQGKEPSQFGAIFQPMVVLKGGLCSGYKYIADKGLNDETYTTESLALIQISGTFMHNNKAVQVDLSTYEQQQLAANMAEFLKVRILLKNFVGKGVFSILSCLQWPLVFIAEVDRHGCIFGWILS
nr:villin-2-like [Ipomoea batatas]